MPLLKPPKLLFPPWTAAALAAALLVTLTTTGCNPSSPSRPAPASVLSESEKQAQADALLDNALHLLSEHRGAASSEAFEQVRSLLNQWLRETGRTETMALAPAAEQFLQQQTANGQFRSEQTKTIELQRFTPRDAAHINFCMLLADVVRHARGPDPEDLQQTQSVFDWIVRNVELIPADDEDRVVLLRQLTDSAEGTTAMASLPMTTGQGTAMDRSWVFVQLLRQLKLDACLVGREASQFPGGIEPWWIGVRIGGELYLFDPQLGLPLPGSQEGTVTTMRDLVEDPEAVLGRLNLPNGPPYHIQPEDLRGLCLGIDATETYWAPRMKLLETQMVGARRPVVLYEELGPLRSLGDSADQPEELGALPERFERAAGITNHDLWAQEPIRLVDIPAMLLAQVPQGVPDPRKAELLLQPFQGATSEEIQRFRLRGRFLDAALAETRTAFSQAHTHQLQGQWDEATNAYQQVITRCAQALGSSGQLRNVQRHLFGVLYEMASYRIGMCQYEQGRYELAAETWFRSHLRNFPEGKQRNAVRYMLARSLEELAKEVPPAEDQNRKRLEEAVQIYRESDSPQQHGDHHRALWLRQRRE